MDKWQIVKFQLLTHCYINHIELTPSELDSLTLLGLLGECKTATFCEEAVDKGIFGNPQAARNCLMRISRKTELLKKTEGYNSTVNIHPVVKVQASGNIMLDFKFFSLGS